MQLVFTPEGEGAKPEVMNVYDFKAPGVAMAMYNTDDVSIPLAIVCMLLRIGLGV